MLLTFVNTPISAGESQAFARRTEMLSARGDGRKHLLPQRENTGAEPLDFPANSGGRSTSGVDWDRRRPEPNVQHRASRTVS